MAEREGFEPPIPVKVCPLSRRIVSTTHAPLRVGHAVNREILRARRAQDFACGFPLRHARKTAQLTTILKERLQQFCAAARKNSAANLQNVIQLRMVQDLHHGTNGPGFGIV